MPTASAEIRIARPVQAVWAYYSDLRHLPEFLGDVLSVEPMGSGDYRWTVAMPLGARIRWVTRTRLSEPDRRLVFATRTLGLTTAWDVRFAPDGPAATVVSERLTMPGGRAALFALALVGKHPAREVRANLDRLRQRLETGVVTDDDATTGKRFGDHA